MDYSGLRSVRKLRKQTVYTILLRILTEMRRREVRQKLIESGEVLVCFYFVLKERDVSMFIIRCQ